VISGCSLERNEHTVQFQQLQQPNVTDDLPVWLDVYSKSVHEEVYSPQGNSELLPWHSCYHSSSSHFLE
jgi:hypothetical protein